MSESQRGVDRTTAISTDYLRFITNTFERSLAAGQAPLIEWTDALQREHQSVMHQIREDATPSASISTNLPSYRNGLSMTESSYHSGQVGKEAANRSEYHDILHEELDHKPRELDGPGARYQSRLNISRSTRRVEPEVPDEIIIFGDRLGDEGALSLPIFTRILKIGYGILTDIARH